MKFTDFSLSDITFGDNNSKGIKLSLPNGDPIQIQIPRLYAPFGLSGFPDKFGPPRFNIDASLRGWKEEGSYVNKFFKFLTNVETVILDHVRTLNVLPGDPSEFFNSNLKLSDKYDPKVRFASLHTAQTHAHEFLVRSSVSRLTTTRSSSGRNART